MSAILNLKISNLDFLAPKTLKMCYYMTIYDDKGGFCAIFYLSFILATILEAILVAVFKNGGNFEKNADDSEDLKKTNLDYLTGRMLTLIK